MDERAWFTRNNQQEIIVKNYEVREIVEWHHHQYSKGTMPLEKKIKSIH